MALRRPPVKKLINTFSANTVKVVNGIIYIEKFGSFKPADVAKCFKECSGAEQLKQVCLTVVIEDGCECPPSYDITVVKLQDPTKFEIQNTFNDAILVDYDKPGGASFTAAEAAAGIVSRVNSNPAQPATAQQVTSCTDRTPNVAGVAVLFTAKEAKTNYDVFNPLGTAPTIITPYKRPILSSEDMHQLFPIQPGQFGQTPDLPFCGTYCRYHLLIRNCCGSDVLSDQYAIDKDREYLAHEVEVDFYVNQDAAGFAANWDNILLAQLPCLNASSSAAGSVVVV